MPRIINQLLLIAGVIAVVAGLLAMQLNPVFAVLAAPGVVAVVVAYRSDRRRAARRDEQMHVDTVQRIASLTARPWSGSQSLQVRQARALPIVVLLLMLLGGSVIYLPLHGSAPRWLVQAAGGGLIVMGAFLLPRLLAGVGRPALQLTSLGVDSPLYGRIAWRNVTGIVMQSVTVRERTTHRLMLRVPRLAEVAGTTHWTDRLLAALRMGPLVHQVITVPILGGGERPEVVEAVARFLWKQATGNDYEWQPWASDAVNEALRRTGELNARIGGQRAAEPTLAEMRQAERDASLIGDDLKRRARKLRWGTGIVIALVLIRFVWVLVTAFHPS